MAFSSVKDQSAIRTISFLWQHGVFYNIFFFLEGGKGELASFFYTITMTLKKKTIHPNCGFVLSQAWSFGATYQERERGRGRIFVESR